MATKFSRVVTNLEGFLPIISLDILVTWSNEVM